MENTKIKEFKCDISRWFSNIVSYLRHESFFCSFASLISSNFSPSFDIQRKKMKPPQSNDPHKMPRLMVIGITTKAVIWKNNFSKITFLVPWVWVRLSENQIADKTYGESIASIEAGWSEWENDSSHRFQQLEINRWPEPHVLQVLQMLL